MRKRKKKSKKKAKKKKPLIIRRINDPILKATCFEYLKNEVEIRKSNSIDKKLRDGKEKGVTPRKFAALVRKFVDGMPDAVTKSFLQEV